MPDKSLEQQMQEMLSGLEFKPDDKVWEVIRTEIREEKKRRFAFWWWLLPVLIGAVIVTGLFMHNANSNKKSSTSVTSTTTTEEGIMAVTPKANAENNKTDDQINAAKTVKPKGDGGNIVASKNTNAVNSNTSGSKDKVTINKSNTDKRDAMLVEKKAEGSDALINTNTTANTKQSQTPVVRNDLQSATAIAPVQQENNKKSDDIQEPVIAPKNDVDKNITEKAALVKVADSATATAPVIVTKAGNKKWKLAAVADVSAAKLSKSIIDGINADKVSSDNFVNASPGSGAGSGGQFQNYASTYTQQTPFKGYELSFGVQAEKPLNSRWSFITGLEYQYIHYTSRTYTYRDSFTYLSNTASFSSSGRVASSGGDVGYSIHYLSVPLLFQYKIVQPVYVYAGLQNGFVLSARKTEHKVDYLTQQNTSGSASIKDAVYTYQPSFSFGVNIALYDAKKYTWFVAPHVDYGITKTFRESMEKNNALRYGLQLSVQMKNKKSK